MVTNKKLVFESEVQVALFVHEIRGQLSDGQWENSHPYNHYVPWCDADVVVGENPGRNFYAQKSNYNLIASDLLEIVGERMIVYARLCIAYGLEAVDVLKHAVDLDGKFHGLPNYSDHGTSTYWADIRTKLAAYNMDEVKTVIENSTYTMKDLRRDLRTMKKAMRHYNG